MKTGVIYIVCLVVTVAVTKLIFNIVSTVPTVYVYQDMDGECTEVVFYWNPTRTTAGSCDALPNTYTVVHVATPDEHQVNP